MTETLHRVTFNFSDGICHEIEVEHGQNILEKALEAELPLLYQCRSGSCSSCTAFLSEGEAHTHSGASSTLLASEYKAGQRLLCVCEPHSSCTFNLPYASNIAGSDIQEVHAFVDSIEYIACNVVKITVELADGYWVEFRSGQFFQIEVPGVGTVRSYSPASTNKDLPYLTFLIRILPEGVMSDYIRNHLLEGDVLKMTGAYGAFFLREEYHRQPHIFIAGGTGLAPVFSMIETLRNKSGKKPPILLIFGCATPEYLFYVDEIELLQQWLPSLEVRIVVDQYPTEGLYHGSPVSVLNEMDVMPNSVAYLCGPPGMMNAATEKLISFGINSDNVYSEQFVSSK